MGLSFALDGGGMLKPFRYPVSPLFLRQLSASLVCQAGLGLPQVRIENLEMEVKTLNKKLETKQKQVSLDQYAFPNKGQYELPFLAVLSKGNHSKAQEVSIGRRSQKSWL